MTTTLRAKLARWVDEWRLAFAGLMLAFHSWKFVLTILITFVLFGTLMGMLAYSASWTYLWRLPDFFAKIAYLGERFVSIFDVTNLTTLIITILQSILIGLIVFIFHKNKAKKTNTNRSAGVQKAGLVTGLAILAGGCPTCGTSLLMPLVGAIFTGSSAVVGSVISWALTYLAILIALLSFKKLGEETYVIIVSERRRKHAKK